MALSSIFSDTAFPMALRAAGTFNSGPMAAAGVAEHVAVFVDVSAAAGTTHSLDLVVQTSPDATTWTTVTRSAITQITGTTGSAIVYCNTDAQYFQVQAVVGGTGVPTVTFGVEVVLI